MENNEHQNQTLYQAGKTRMIDYVARHSISTSLGLVWHAIVGMFTFTSLLTFFLSPDYAMLCLMLGLEWRDALLLRMAAAAYCTARMPRLVAHLHTLWDGMFATEEAPLPDLGTFEGADVAKLIAVLVSGHHFSRDYVRSKVGISIKKHEQLQALFEEAGILIRQDDNSVDLDPDYSYDDLCQIFAECKTADRMRTMCQGPSKLRWIVSPNRIPIRARMKL